MQPSSRWLRELVGVAVEASITSDCLQFSFLGI